MLKMSILVAALVALYAYLDKSGASTAAMTLSLSGAFIATLILGLLRDA